MLQLNMEVLVPLLVHEVLVLRLVPELLELQLVGLVRDWMARVSMVL